MKSEILLLLIVLLGVGSCACYSARRADQAVTKIVEQAMEVRP